MSVEPEDLELFRIKRRMARRVRKCAAERGVARALEEFATNFGFASELHTIWQRAGEHGLDYAIELVFVLDEERTAAWHRADTRMEAWLARLGCRP